MVEKAATGVLRGIHAYCANCCADSSCVNYVDVDSLRKLRYIPASLARMASLAVGNDCCEREKESLR